MPGVRRVRLLAIAAACTALAAPTLVGTGGAAAAALAVATPPTGGTVNGFAYGELQTKTVGAAGCGTNVAGEPSIHVTKDNLTALGSEDGVGSGSEFWSKAAIGGGGASACAPFYRGQPNGFSNVGASGGDIDIALAPQEDPANGKYRIYVASLNLGSINVATSSDNGKSFTQVPVQGGIPIDDREWIAAYGVSTSLLSYHDIPTNNINILKSTNGGQLYTQVATAIPTGNYKAQNNELGNIVIDHNISQPGGNFWAYQSFVAPSSSSGSVFNEAFLAVSNTGGSSWVDKPIPCSTKFGAAGLAHNFPNVSVAPNGTIFYAVSNDTGIHVAMSSDHGNSWSCSGRISTPVQAVFPWIVATNAGEDLVYYGRTGSGASQVWSVYFAQNPTQAVSGWTTRKLMPVHQGPICEGGISCTGGRQLLDDFGIDTDQAGWAHIAYSHDSPNLGGSGSFTGYAVQQSGTKAGKPN
jgi:hypothetical protein